MIDARKIAIRPAAWVVASCMLVAVPAGGEAVAGARMRLAEDGRALAKVVVATGGDAAERTAAAELAAWLGRVTGGRFDVVDEGSPVEAPALWVGPTAVAARAGIVSERLAPESWVIAPVEGGLVLAGGRPRGTLYAVFTFLEQRVGVRWWSPYHEDAPRRPDLRVGRHAERGEPTFAYRDIHGIDGPRAFCARNRLNGHYSKLPPAWGGVEEYGPPRHVHTFIAYVPPDEWFEEHPEYFSETAGLRHTEGQLCLTNPGLRGLVLERLRDYIDEGTRRALADGRSPPRLYDVSQNDWGGPCSCASCSRLVEREGSQAGPLVDFLNELAAGIAETHPDVLIDSLAYHYTLQPPATLVADERLVFRFSGLQRRDFLRPLRHPDNAVVRDALQGWRRVATHLRVWDYSVLFSDHGELPLPNLRVMADDFALYRELGIEGVFIQHEYPIAGDMRDLKLWVLAKLLEDPSRDVDGLVREFTDGFYGTAGRHVRRALRAIERRAGRNEGALRYRAPPEAFGYLSPGLLRRAHRHFQRAEAAVAAEPELVDRVRHARLSLDRATLVLHGRDPATAGRWLDLDRLVGRYRETWRTQIDLRLGPDWAPWALEEVEREVRWWTGQVDAEQRPDGL